LVQRGKETGKMKQTDIKSVLGKEDVIDLVGQQWMLVTAGTKENFNTMTA